MDKVLISVEALTNSLETAISNTEIQATADYGNKRESTSSGVQKEANRDVLIADILTAVDDSKWFPDINLWIAEKVVKPIFHTFLLPDTFLTKRRSCAVVTEGEADALRTLAFNEAGDNLDAVVDDTRGKGAEFIFDDGMELGAKWIFNPKQTAIAVDLANANAEMLGEDIEATKLPSIHFEINSDEALLLTRPESRGVVHDCFSSISEEC